MSALGLLGFGPEGWGDELAAGAWLTIRLALATLPLALRSVPGGGAGAELAAPLAPHPRQRLHHDLPWPARTPHCSSSISAGRWFSIAGFATGGEVEVSAFVAGLIAPRPGLLGLCQRGAPGALARSAADSTRGGLRPRPPAADARFVSSCCRSSIRLALPGLATSGWSSSRTPAGLGDRAQRPLARDVGGGARHQGAVPLLSRRLPDLPRDVDGLLGRHRPDRAVVGAGDGPVDERELFERYGLRMLDGSSSPSSWW